MYGTDAHDVHCTRYDVKLDMAEQKSSLKRLLFVCSLTRYVLLGTIDRGDDMQKQKEEESYMSNHVQEITFVDEFGGIHTGVLFDKDGTFYLKYQNGNKEETCDICPVNKANIPFINEFAEWTLKKIVNMDLLERWDELL